MFHKSYSTIAIRINAVKSEADMKLAVQKKGIFTKLSMTSETREEADELIRKNFELTRKRRLFGKVKISGSVEKNDVVLEISFL